MREAQAAYDTSTDIGISDEHLAEISKRIDYIVKRHTKIDWHDNPDVHNRIKQEVEDMIFDFADDHNLEIDFDQVDKILEEITTVALRRY